MIITLSRQQGSFGDEIARRVADALGLLLADRSYIRDAALAAGIPHDVLQRLMYEGQRTVAAQVRESFGGPVAGGAASHLSPLGGIFMPPFPPASIGLEEAVCAIRELMSEIARRQSILVLGQGGQALLRDCPGAQHVQIVAPLTVRVARVADADGLTLAVARRAVKASDAARADYVARYHNVNWLDPLLYHLVINTGLTSLETAVALMIQHAGLA